MEGIPLVYLEERRGEMLIKDLYDINSALLMSAKKDVKILNDK
jgi:hypothetical protein